VIERLFLCINKLAKLCKKHKKAANLGCFIDFENNNSL